jgi:hypothetical protein
VYPLALCTGPLTTPFSPISIHCVQLVGAASFGRSFAAATASAVPFGRAVGRVRHPG